MGIAEKKADKRKRLMNAAYEYFSEQGPWDATINDICKKAGVAKGTFYLYFNNKEALYLSLVDAISNDICNEIEREIRLRKCSTPEEIMCTVIDKYNEIMTGDIGMLKFLRGQMNWPGADSYSGLVMRLKDAILQAETDAKQAEALIIKLLSVLGMMGNVLFSSMTYGSPSSPERCVEAVKEISSEIIHSVLGPESV